MTPLDRGVEIFTTLVTDYLPQIGFKGLTAKPCLTKHLVDAKLCTEEEAGRIATIFTLKFDTRTLIAEIIRQLDIQPRSP